MTFFYKSLLSLKGPWRALVGLTLVVVLCSFAFQLIGWALPYFAEPIGSRAELFKEGARTTLLLTISSGIVGLFLGVLAALAKIGPFAPMRYLSHFYLWLFRGTPLLTQILFVYYAVPVLFPFLKMNEMMGAFVALSLNVGAYHAEAVRAGILSVPRGQIEAAQLLGLSRRQISWKIILPQALPVMVPPLLNNLVALLKDSAMASVIGLLELTLAGNRVASETFLPVPVFATLAITYLFLTTTITWASQLFLIGVVKLDWFTDKAKK